MENGEVTKYVNKYPDVNRKRIVRRIAEGLRLLHTFDPPIVHGDIKGQNILINNEGNPLLTDFSLSKVRQSIGIYVLEFISLSVVCRSWKI